VGFGLDVMVNAYLDLPIDSEEHWNEAFAIQFAGVVYQTLDSRGSIDLRGLIAILKGYLTRLVQF
jgi:hypothetical protein